MSRPSTLITYSLADNSHVDDVTVYSSAAALRPSRHLAAAAAAVVVVVGAAAVEAEAIDVSAHVPPAAAAAAETGLVALYLGRHVYPYDLSLSFFLAGCTACTSPPRRLLSPKRVAARGGVSPDFRSKSCLKALYAGHLDLQITQLKTTPSCKRIHISRKSRGISRCDVLRTNNVIFLQFWKYNGYLRKILPDFLIRAYL